jgi:hypothetical protein
LIIPAYHIQLQAWQPEPTPKKDPTKIAGNLSISHPIPKTDSSRKNCAITPINLRIALWISDIFFQKVIWFTLGKASLKKEGVIGWF